MLAATDIPALLTVGASAIAIISGTAGAALFAGAQSERLSSLRDKIDSVETGVLGALAAAEERQVKALAASEERQVKALTAVETGVLTALAASEERQVKALTASEERQVKALAASEERQVKALTAVEMAGKEAKAEVLAALTASEGRLMGALAAVETRHVVSEGRQVEALAAVEERLSALERNNVQPLPVLLQAARQVPRVEGGWVGGVGGCCGVSLPPTVASCLAASVCRAASQSGCTCVHAPPLLTATPHATDASPTLPSPCADGGPRTVGQQVGRRQLTATAPRRPPCRCGGWEGGGAGAQCPARHPPSGFQP